jgi:hypothetical protein
MKLFLLAAMSGAIISCGASFRSDSVGAGGSADASAGAAGSGAGGDSSGTTSAGGSAGSGGMIGAGGSVVTSGGGSVGSGGSSGAGGSAGSGGVGGKAGSANAGGAAGGGGAGAAGRAGGGGAAGSVVDAGRDTGAGDAGGPVCKIDSDCKLVDDCCLGCLAKEASFVVPACGQTCFVNPCFGHQVKGVRCVQGACTLAAECDSSVVTCMAPTPACPPGEVPSISGTCWSGQCVKASACRTVKDCSACDPNLYICGTTQTQAGNQVRCVDTPQACGPDRSCSCAGSYVCMPPYRACSSGAMPGSSQLFCSCPNC